MSSPIQTLPRELFDHFVVHLTIHDIVQLMKTSKACHALLEPLLWGKIELHHEGLHDKQTLSAIQAEEAAERPELPYALAPAPPKLSKSLARVYKKISAMSAEERAICALAPIEKKRSGLSKATRLLKTLSTHARFGAGLNKARICHLASLVTLLCLTVQPLSRKKDVWNPFTKFVNLEYLEISAFWTKPTKRVQFYGSKKSLSKLRTVKLSGYLPKEFVQWVLKEPANIEELQLAILDFPMHSNYRHIPRKDWVPPEAQSRMRLISGGTLMYDGENMCFGDVAPRVLPCCSPSIIDKLKNLKKLYLFKPAASGLRDTIDPSCLYYSSKSDKQALEEWKSLIRATRNTLEYIILDQRIVATESPFRSSTEHHMCEHANGPSYESFVEMVLPTLLESEEFPALKIIRLFGFEPDPGFSSTWGHLYPPNTSVNVPAQLQAAFPNAKVTDHIGRRLMMIWSTGEVTSTAYKEMEKRWGSNSDVGIINSDDEDYFFTM